MTIAGRYVPAGRCNRSALKWDGHGPLAPSVQRQPSVSVCPVRVLMSVVDAQLTCSLRRSECCCANHLVSSRLVPADRSGGHQTSDQRRCPAVAQVSALLTQH